MKTSKPERILQKELRKRKIKFKSNFKINNHKVDIFIKPNICVEVDGKIFHNFPFGTDKDRNETMWMKTNGYIVMRFWDYEVLNDVKNIVDSIESKTSMGNLFNFDPVKFSFQFY